MTAKEYLGQIRLADIKIRQLEERLDSMKSLGGAIQYDKPLVQSTPENVTEDRLIEVIDMEREISVEKIRLEKLKNKITLEIQKLTDPRYVQALYYRYVLRMNPEEISVVMKYEYNSVRRIVRYARKAFAEMYNLEPESVYDMYELVDAGSEDDN